jgi:hypothetical protein
VFFIVQVKMHDKLGMQVIPLRLLTPYESKLFTLDLVRSMNPNDPQNKKNRGKLIVELTFDPFREDNMASDGEGNASIRREADGESSGGVLLVSVESAEDVEGKRHTNPYAEVLFRGERKKTKVTLPNYFFLCSNAHLFLKFVLRNVASPHLKFSDIFYLF